MASEVALVSSGNRAASACDLYEAGILVYGSSYNIMVVDLRKSPPRLLDDKSIMTAHRAKIVAISALKDKTENDLIVSASEDSVVKVWDMGSRNCIATTEVKECHALSWFMSNAPTVIASEHSNVLKWSYKQGSTRKIKSGYNQSILIISHNPVNNEIIATGHKYGAVFIIDVKNENVIHKLKVHSMDIYNLSWSSVSSDTLLSVSMDMSARVWKLGETHPVHTYYLPSSRKLDEKRQAQLFGIFYPGSENTIICCSRGEIGSVTFKGKGKPEFHPFWVSGSEVLHKGIYYFCTWKVDSESGKKDMLCAVAPFKISIFDLEDKKCLLSLCCNYSPIHKLVVSPVNPNLIAVCCADGNVKLWNQSAEPSSSNFYSIFVYSRIRILCGAFHPVEEHLLAYGTDDGRIGIIDVSKKKFMYSFETHHSNSTYALCWGPCSKAAPPEGKSTEEFFLYSCGGGAIYINRLNEPKSPALNFDELSDVPPELSDCKKDHCDMSWKQDYSCFAIGSYKGYVDLYSAQFSFLGRLIVPAMCIECLSWHPECTLSSPDASPLKMWLAIGGKFLDIYVFDTAEVIEKGEKVVIRPTRKLTGHTKSSLSLSWSIHMDGFLASSSRDGTAQIWNAVQGTCVANYPAHRDCVSSVLWHLQNPDVMMSAGQDGCLRIWKISEQTETSPPPAEKRILVRKPRPYKPKPKTSNVEDTNVTGGTSPANKETVAEEVQKKKIDEADVPPSNNKDTNLQEKKSDDFECLTKRGNRRSVYCRKPPPIFPLFAQDQGVKGIEDCKRLVDLFYSDTTDQSLSFEELQAKLPASEEDALKFGGFADQLMALSMLEAQSNHFKEENNPEPYEYLQLQMLNVRNMIDEACKNEKLTDFLVSLAPMVSHKYWLEVCEKYAVQLIGDDCVRKGSLYLLMCGKLYEAINALAEKGNVFEGLVLAKAHLPESDPVVEKLLRCSASKFRHMKFYAFEAQCAIALKEPLTAARILCLLPDPNGARIAAYVCRKFGFEVEAKNCAFLCLEKCLSRLDWATAKKLTTEEESMQLYSMLVHVHEIVYAHVRHLKKENGVLVKGMLCNEPTNSVLFWNGRTCKDSNQSLISYIYTYLTSQGLLILQEQFLENMHEALNIMLDFRKNSDMAAEAHISVALYLTQYVVLALKEDLELASRYFLKIFEVSCNVVFMPKIVSMLLLPVELYWSKKMNLVTWEAKNAVDRACPIIHFCGLYSSFAQKIADWEMYEEDISVISEARLSDLPSVVDTVRDILSRKKAFDLIAAYFCVNFLNELQSVVSKQKPSSECRPSKEREVRESVSAVVRSGTPAGGGSSDRGSEMRKELEENNDIERLVEMALSEANAKAEELRRIGGDVKVAAENLANDLRAEVDAEPVHIVENGPAVDNSSDRSSGTLRELGENDNTEIALEGSNAKVELLRIEKDVRVAEGNLVPNGCTKVDVGQEDSEAKNSEADISLSSPSEGEDETNGVAENATAACDSENGGVGMRLKESEEIISCVSDGKNNRECESLGCASSSNKGENETNGIAGNESMVHESGNAEDDTRLGEMPEDGKTAEVDPTRKLERENISKLNTMSHELCLEEISIFCNVVKLMCKIVFKDEFALFYYLQDLVKYINQEMASASVTSHKPVDVLENGHARNASDTEVVPHEHKETEFQSPDGVEHIDEKGSGYIEAESDKKDVFTPSDASAALQDPKSDGQGCDKEAKLDDKLSLNSDEDKTSGEFLHCGDGKDIESPKRLSTFSNGELNGSESLEHIESQTADTSDFTVARSNENGALECELFTTEQPKVVKQEGEELKLNYGGDEQEERVSVEKNAVDNNHVSSVPKNTKYQEEKKQILELISILENEHKEMPYPNPFIAASKVVQACSDIFYKSACGLVRSKVHELLHGVLLWVEKFSVNQVPCLSCQICKAVA